MIDSYTSPYLDDEYDEDGTYLWDCCNTDYCAVKRKKFFKYSCLKGGSSPRCSREEKWNIRLEAQVNGFHFPKNLS